MNVGDREYRPVNLGKSKDIILEQLSSLAQTYGEAVLSLAIKERNRRRKSIKYPEARIRISMSSRLRIYQRQTAKCAICQGYMSFREMEIDHIVALALGGKNEMKNYQGAHRHCNRSKSSKSLLQLSKEGSGTIKQQLERGE